MARLVQRLGLTRYEADEFYKLGLEAYRKRQLDEAIINIGHAIEHLPGNSEYYAARGFIYLEDGIDDKAKADFEEALKRFEWEMLAHYGLGVIAFRAREWDEALKHFTNAYRANPQRVETIYYIGLVYFQLRQYNHALQTMRVASAMFEQANDKRKADATKWIKEIERNLLLPPQMPLPE